MKSTLLRLLCQTRFNFTNLINLLKKGFKHTFFDFVSKPYTINFVFFHIKPNKQYEYIKLLVSKTDESLKIKESQGTPKEKTEKKK